MNTKELIREIANTEELTHAKARSVLKTIVTIITDELKNNSPVTITNFGKFYVSERKERKGVNPQTGKEMIISKINTARFQVYTNLKRVIKATTKD